jgi:hypothetical protein
LEKDIKNKEIIITESKDVPEIYLNKDHLTYLFVLWVIPAYLRGYPRLPAGLSPPVLIGISVGAIFE